MSGSTAAELKEIFNVKAFLAKKDATKANSFIYRLAETTMFANFIEVQFLDGLEKQELLYFSKLISQERTKAQPTVIVPFVPLKTTRSYPPNTQGIDPASTFLRFLTCIIEVYQYTFFPKLNPEEFLPSRLADQPSEETIPATIFRKDDEASATAHSIPGRRRRSRR